MEGTSPVRAGVSLANQLGLTLFVECLNMNAFVSFKFLQKSGDGPVEFDAVVRHRLSATRH